VSDSQPETNLDDSRNHRDGVGAGQKSRRHALFRNSQKLIENIRGIQDAAFFFSGSVSGGCSEDTKNNGECDLA
jgi:hypothetical protein